MSEDGNESLREWFDYFTEATGERPTHIVFAWSEWSYRDHSDWAIPDGLVEFDTLTDELLDKRFDAGFGGTESPNLCAWSESWVLFSDNYDGAEGLHWVPRNPTAHNPIRPGGG